VTFERTIGWGFRSSNASNLYGLNFYEHLPSVQPVNQNLAAVEEAEDEAPELEDNSGIDVLESSSSDGDFEDDEEGS